MKRLLISVLLLYVLPLTVAAAWSMASGWPESWRTADWSSTDTAPDPFVDTRAMVLVYAAPAGRWKGAFSVHSWIVFKRAGALRFTRFDVVGWGRPVRMNAYPPDGRWYGNSPELILDISGDRAAQLIPLIEAAVQRYPFTARGSYRVWPGPNSNTFVAWIGRQVPQLNLEMPANALGKDYLGDGINFSATPSGTGWQFSLWGVVGIALARKEGLELHLLGTTIGLDFDDMGIKLPGFGTLSIAGLWSV